MLNFVKKDCPDEELFNTLNGINESPNYATVENIKRALIINDKPFYASFGDKDTVRKNIEIMSREDCISADKIGVMFRLSPDKYLRGIILSVPECVNEFDALYFVISYYAHQAEYYTCELIEKGVYGLRRNEGNLIRVYEKEPNVDEVWEIIDQQYDIAMREGLYFALLHQGKENYNAYILFDNNDSKFLDHWFGEDFVCDKFNCEGNSYYIVHSSAKGNYALLRCKNNNFESLCEEDVHNVKELSALSEFLLFDGNEGIGDSADSDISKNYIEDIKEIKKIWEVCNASYDEDAYNKLLDLAKDFYRNYSVKHKNATIANHLLAVIEIAYSICGTLNNKKNDIHYFNIYLWEYWLGRCLILSKINIEHGKNTFNRFVERASGLVGKIQRSEINIIDMLIKIAVISIDICDDFATFESVSKLSLELLSSLDHTDPVIWTHMIRIYSDMADTYHHVKDYPNRIIALDTAKQILDQVNLTEDKENEAPLTSWSYHIAKNRLDAYCNSGDSDKLYDCFENYIQLIPKYISSSESGEKIEKIYRKIAKDYKKLGYMLINHTSLLEHADLLEKYHDFYTKLIQLHPQKHGLEEMHDAILAVERIVREYICSFEEERAIFTENDINNAIHWFDMYINEYNVLEKQVGIEKESISDICPLNIYFEFADFLVLNNFDEKAKEYYKTGAELRKNIIGENDRLELSPKRIMRKEFKTVEGLKPIAADLLSLDDYKNLPESLRIIDKKWWLKPEQKGYTSSFVDELGNIKTCSTLKRWGLRIVLVFAETLTGYKLYDSIRFDGMDWHVIDHNRILADSCLKESWYYRDADSWFVYKYRTFTVDDIHEKDVIEIPEWVESIANSVGRDNLHVKEVIIPGSITDIGNNVFSNCPKLSKVTFKNSYIDNFMRNGSGIFRDCPNLKEVYFANFDTFDHYSFDAGGPLENGSKLFIDGEQVRKFIIPGKLPSGRHNFVRNLAGAEIDDIVFDDGSKPVLYEYEIRTKSCCGSARGITKYSFAKELIEKDIQQDQKLKFKCIDDIKEFVGEPSNYINHRPGTCYGIDVVITSMDEFEKIIECNNISNKSS